MESENVYAAPQSNNPQTTEPKKSKWQRPVEGLVVLGIIAILIGMLWPMRRGGSYQAARRVHCLNNCRQIGLAMLNYEATNGHFPPAYIADEDGKPMHSWRVLILPHLEQQELYDRYDMDEPWDGPNNSKLHDEIVDLYRCPNSSSAKNCADYVLITGKKTAFENDQTIGLKDISDGTTNTIMLTEISDSKIHWMQPQDISQEQFLTVEKPDDSATNHPSTKNVALFDSSSHAIGNDASPQELRKLIEIADGEVVDITDL